MIACVHDARDCPGYPNQFVQSNDHVRRQHDVRENVLQVPYIFCLSDLWFIGRLVYREVLVQTINIASTIL